jgi:hypothetical protein
MESFFAGLINRYSETDRHGTALEKAAQLALYRLRRTETGARVGDEDLIGNPGVTSG